MAIISIPNSIAGVSLPSSINTPNGPLASLFAGPGLDTYHWPSDLATDPSKSHYVQFSVSEIIPADYGSNPGQGRIDKSSLIGGDAVNFTGVGSFLQGLADEATSFFGGNSNNSSDSGGLSLGSLGSTITDTIGTVTNAISQGLTISPQRTKPTAVISLYMPDSLNATYSASYDEIRLTDLGSAYTTLKAIDQIAQKGQRQDIGASGGSLSQQMKRVAKTAGNIASTDPAAVALLTKLGASGINDLGKGLGLGLDAQLFSDLAVKGKGYAVNPQLQMIYRGVGLRGFQLNFIFTPNSSEESQQIDHIVNMFKYHFAPSLQNATQTETNNMYLVPPSIFNVSFMINSDENVYLPKYGDCVLTDIDVNYAPNGFAAYEDGAPVQTQLTLGFKEVEIVTKEKIQAGFSNPNVKGGLR
jgi:hypothetical protein